MKATRQTRRPSAPAPSFAPARMGVLQRKCACGGTPEPTGECAECRRKRKLGLQPKLRVNRPGDKYEREADRVADQVIRISPVARPAPPIIQRLGPESARPPEEEEEEEIQAKAMSDHTPQATSEAASLIQALRGAGAPLPAPERAFFESRFGHDFSRVRVHTDMPAAAAARTVQARAFTVGHDIVFGADQFAPGTMAGQLILAHELTHVVQQGGHEPSLGTHGAARLQRLGANQGCTAARARAIHQAIFNARGWLNKAIPQVEASPLSERARRSLRRNFGPTYGVPANASLIAGRLRAAYREISTIPYRCRGAGDALCGRASPPCGYAHAGAGGHAATVCNATLAAGAHWVFGAGCVLHEGLHAAFSRFTAARDSYSGWHGHSSSSPGYPGAGTGPLLNADSYTTLAMDLS